MKKRFSEDQIHKILKESESGVSTPEICRKYGISGNTFYRWRSKYGGLELSDLKRMKVLEEENSKLKKLFAEQALELEAIKMLLEKSGEPRAETRGDSVNQNATWRTKILSSLANLQNRLSSSFQTSRQKQGIKGSNSFFGI